MFLIMYFIACCLFLTFIIGITTGLSSFFKKRKFRNFIRECGILEDEKVRTESWIGDLSYIREGLYDWEQTILKEELERVKQEKGKEKGKEEMKKSRKEFFENWGSK